MGDINLLQNKQIEQNPGKKRNVSSNIEFSRPDKQADDSKKKIKEGGMMSFMGTFFKKKPPKTPETKTSAASTQAARVNMQNTAIKPVPQNDARKTAPSKLVFTPISENKNTTEVPKPASLNQPRPGFNETAMPKNKVFFNDPRQAKTPVKNKFSQIAKAPVKEKKSGNENLPPEEKGGGLEVNLIPDDVLADLEPINKLKQLGLVVLAVALITGLGYGYLIFRQSQIKGSISNVIKDIAKVDEETAGYDKIWKDAQSLKKQIDSVSAALDSHIYWSQFLGYLESYTLPGVYYTDLSGTAAGKITLTAKAADLDTLSKQYIVFQNAADFVQNVSIDSAITDKDSIPAGAVDFSISLTVNADVFYKK